jgi:hypothetical protein
VRTVRRSTDTGDHLLLAVVLIVGWALLLFVVVHLAVVAL